MRLPMRTADDALLLGVCGGLGAATGAASLWLRLAFVLTSFAWGLGVVLYLILALAMPAPEGGAEPLRERLGRIWDDGGRAASRLGDRLRDGTQRWLDRPQAGLLDSLGIRTVLGGLTLLCGLALLLFSFGLLNWLTPGRAVALAMCLFGLGLLIGRRPGA